MEHTNKWVKVILFITLFFFSFISAYAISKAQDNKQYVFSKIEDSIYSTLIENGYSKAAACGILGNISIENPNFEPDLHANRDRTYGLFQWSDVGKRKSNLIRWCNNRLLYPNSVEGQLAFAMHEINGGDPQASRLYDYLQIADDPSEAAMEFAAGFERCVGETKNPDADGIYQGNIYDEFKGRSYQALSYRMNNAKKYYDGYVGVSGLEESALQIEITPTAGIVAEKESEMEFKLLESVPVEKTSNKKLLFLYRFLSVIIGYLFGCILGVTVIIRNVRQKEALHINDKLPSLISVLRHVGVRQCFFATLIDLLKFYIALLVVYFITKGALGSEQILLVGIGVLFGNAFPFWRKFKGGMGLIVTTAFICTYMPIWGYVCCLLGFIVAIIFKSLPFGAICISLFAVPYAFFLKGIEGGIFITIALLLVLIKHYRFIIQFVGKEHLRRHYRSRRHGVGVSGDGSI